MKVPSSAEGPREPPQYHRGNRRLTGTIRAENDHEQTGWLHEPLKPPHQAERQPQRRVERVREPKAPVCTHAQPCQRSFHISIAGATPYELRNERLCFVPEPT